MIPLFRCVIDELYEHRRVALMCLIVNLLVFSYALLQAPIGNHDWSRMEGINPDTQTSLGRWFADALFSLTAYQQLPVLNLLLALCFQVFCGIGAVWYFEKASGQSYSGTKYLIGALFVSLIPYACEHYYYSFMAFVFPAAQAFFVIAAMVSLLGRPVVAIPTGALFILLGLATYQPAINTMAILLVGGLVLYVVRVPGQEGAGEVRFGVGSVLNLMAAILLGGGAYKVSLILLDHFGFIYPGAYQLQTLAFSDIPQRLLDILYSLIIQLLYAQPYFPAALKLLSLTVVVLGVVAVVTRLCKQPMDSLGKKSVLLALLGMAALLATRFQFLLSSQDDFYDYRFASSGLSYFYLFFLVAFPLETVRGFRILYLVLVGVLLYGFSIQDIKVQRDIVKQNEYDLRTINRIIARIESIDGFDYDRSYDFVQVGDFTNLKPLHGGYSEVNFWSPPHGYSSMPAWDKAAIYRKVEPNLKISRNYELSDWKDFEGGDRRSGIHNAIKYLQSAPEWPHTGSVEIIDGDLIVVVFRKDRRVEQLLKKLGD